MKRSTWLFIVWSSTNWSWIERYIDTTEKFPIGMGQSWYGESSYLIANGFDFSWGYSIRAHVDTIWNTCIMFSCIYRAGMDKIGVCHTLLTGSSALCFNSSPGSSDIHLYLAFSYNSWEHLACTQLALFWNSLWDYIFACQILSGIYVAHSLTHESIVFYIAARTCFPLWWWMYHLE